MCPTPSIVVRSRFQPHAGAFGALMLALVGCSGSSTAPSQTAASATADPPTKPVRPKLGKSVASIVAADAPAAIGEPFPRVTMRRDATICDVVDAQAQATVAPFDGAVSVLLTAATSSRAKDVHARAVAYAAAVETVAVRSPTQPAADPSEGDVGRRTLAGFDEDQVEAQPVAGTEPVIMVTIEAQAADGGAMLLFEPADHAEVGELMTEIQAALAEPGCVAPASDDPYEDPNPATPS